MADDIELPSVDAITIGTVGEPGGRVFYLQVWSGGEVRSLKLEKQQVIALYSAVNDLLSDLAPVDLAPAPEVVDPGAPDWIVGTMALTGFDESQQRAMLILTELVAEDEIVHARTARIGLTLPQLELIAVRGQEEVEAGRPPCPLCGFPMDPSGHACPKTNGSARH